MQLRGLIKLNARRALRGNWSRAMAIALLLTAVSLLFVMFEMLLTIALDIPSFIDYSGTPSLFLDDLPNYSIPALISVTGVALLSMLVSAPLLLGMVGWFYRVGNGQSEEVSTVFEHFSSFKLLAKAVWLYISVIIRSTLWSLIFLAPAISLLAFSMVSMDAALSDSDRWLSMGGMACAALLGVMGVIFAAIWCMKYFLAAYILVDSPQISVGSAIKQSAVASVGHRIELLYLQLSMVGWEILGILVITKMYTMPYTMTVKGLYARYLMKLRERERNVATTPYTQAPQYYYTQGETIEIPTPLSQPEPRQEYTPEPEPRQEYTPEPETKQED